MGLRRIAYLLALIGALTLHLCWTMYATWLILVVVFLIPIVSVSITLPFLARSRVVLSCGESRSEMEEGELSFEVVPESVVAPVRVRLRVENRFTGKIERHSAKIVPGHKTGKKGKRRDRFAATFPKEMCGVVRCTAERCRTTDIMGIIPLPLRAPEPVEVLIAPAELAFEGPAELLYGDPVQTGQTTGSRSGEREFASVRPYREGDAIRDINWKLSARRDEYVVREFEKNADNLISIFVPWAGKPERLAKTLGRLLGFVRFLSDHELPYVILFEERRDGEEPTVRRVEAGDGDVMEALLWSTLSAQPPIAEDLMRAPLHEGGGADKRVWLVSADAVSLYEGGHLKEVFS